MKLLVSALAVCALALPALADEGMWLYNQFPKDLVKTRYNFEVTDQFLDHLRLSSIRLGGGSGSFVSPNGLIFTNHHVASDCIQKLGSAEHDYMKGGFFAGSSSDELPCPDLEGNVLLRIADVTEQVKAAAKPDAKPADANAQRKAAIAKIEYDCAANSGHRCDVIKLYAGEKYALYEYKTYTDLRLVFAPEFLIAFFGGDPDNFTYPRYDLDVSFLRAYENGKPADTPHFLKWSAEGAKDGDLVFVSGSPGATFRLETNAQLAFEVATYYPLYMARLGARIQLLQEFMAVSDENRRVAQRLAFGLSNSYKSAAGKSGGLRDQKLMLRKRGFEYKLRGAVERDPKLGPEEAKVWDQVAAAYKTWTPNEKQYQILESGAGQSSSLFKIARDIVRFVDEQKKPNGERLARYRDSGRRSLELSMYSTAPITDAVEILMLQQYLTELQKGLGDKDATVKAVLAGRTPEVAAEAYVKSSRLKDVAERKRLATSAEEVAKSDDGMIRLARLLEEPSRKIRKKHEDIIEAVELSAVAKIAAFRFKIFGAKEYPDATGTLRLSFGVIKGYKDKTESPIPWATTFGGLYYRATGEDPYILPPRWAGAKSSLQLTTPLDFVSTADITGGNSGSPTVNQKGELTGIIFDSNIESLPNTYLYSEEQGRAVHVATQGVTEALKKLYKPARLMNELGIPQ